MIIIFINGARPSSVLSLPPDLGPLSFCSPALGAELLPQPTRTVRRSDGQTVRQSRTSLDSGCKLLPSQMQPVFGQSRCGHGRSRITMELQQVLNLEPGHPNPNPNPVSTRFVLLISPASTTSGATSWECSAFPSEM